MSMQKILVCAVDQTLTVAGITTLLDVTGLAIQQLF